MRKVGRLAWLLVLVPGTAWAGDAHYPWKAEVTREAYDAEQAECGAAAKAAMKSPDVPNPWFQPTPGTGSAGAYGSAFASGMARGLAQGNAFKKTYYGCMAAKGYSQRRLPAADVKAFRKLPKDEQKTRLFAMVSAAQPLHPEMPADEYD